MAHCCRFACTSYFCDFQCDYAKKLHDAGHEIGVHTRTHAGALSVQGTWSAWLCSPAAAAAADDAVASCAALAAASLRGACLTTLAGLRFIYDRKTIEDEILGSRTDAQACGLPEGAVQGFRTPYLATSPTVREVLSKGGFR